MLASLEVLSIDFRVRPVYYGKGSLSGNIKGLCRKSQWINGGGYHGIKIVTDSTAYLSKDLLEGFGISEVSLVVNFAGHSFPEGQERNYHRFYEKLRHTQEFPTTSQPAVGDFLETFRRLTDDGSPVISIHISSKLSGTVQSARTAAAMLVDRDISVVDSSFTIAAQLFFVEVAAKMAQIERSKAEILEQVEYMKNHTRLFFMVDSLEYLHRGGRIGGAAALFGTLLQIKPILHLQDGIIDVFTKVRTREKATTRMINEVLTILEHTDRQKLMVGILHVDNPAGAAHLKNLVAEKYPDLELGTFEVGPVIGSHVGPGSTGVVVTELKEAAK